MSDAVQITPEQFEIAERNGISRKNVYQRTREYRMPIEKAITKPLVGSKDMTPEQAKNMIMTILNNQQTIKVKRLKFLFEKMGRPLDEWVHF